MNLDELNRNFSHVILVHKTIKDYMSNILAFSTLAESTGYKSPEHMEAHMCLQQNIFKLSNTLDNLFSLSFPNVNTPLIIKRRFEIVRYTEVLCNSFKRLYALNGRINLEFLPEISHRPVYIDNLHYERIVLNLLSNAAKFKRANGRNKISVKLSSKNETIILSIKDRGIGIKPEDKLKVFEMYKYLPAAPNLYRGNSCGMGLAVSKISAELLGGTIKFTSTVNRCTEFVVSIPSKAPLALADSDREIYKIPDSRILSYI